MKTLTEKDQGIILDLCDAGTDGSAGPQRALSAIRGIIQGPPVEDDWAYRRASQLVKGVDPWCETLRMNIAKQLCEVQRETRGPLIVAMRALAKQLGLDLKQCGLDGDPDGGA